VRAPDTFCRQLLDTLPRLRRYARTLVYDAASADDLTQNTLERALAHWHQFDQRRDMLVWLLSIAHNAFLDQRRRDSRMSYVDPAQADADATALALRHHLEQVAYHQRNVAACATPELEF
jgi:RNA polymerase sigma-70 factor (ECF subfamily)